MSKAVIAAKAPIAIEVEAGKNYFWCSCGKSGKQPFCDGSHKETGFTPIKWTAEEDGKKLFCACKQTDGAPLRWQPRNGVGGRLMPSQPRLTNCYSHWY